jgi:hypothetical protein
VRKSGAKSGSPTHESLQFFLPFSVLLAGAVFWQFSWSDRRPHEPTNFGEMHDDIVDKRKAQGEPDWKVNIPTMPMAYGQAVREETMRSMAGFPGSFSELPQQPRTMTNIRSLSAAIFGVVAVACGTETRTDVSEQSSFKHLVGEEYEIVGTVIAYGLREHSAAPVDYVTLIPPPGIGGSQVGFRISVQPGSRVVVQRVFKTNRWPDPDMSYDVVLKGMPLPTDAPVRIDLFRGNEGKNPSELNPNLYRKLGREASGPSGALRAASVPGSPPTRG